MVTGKSARMLAIDEQEVRERNRLTKLIDKLQRSEKRLLKELGKHPRRDQKTNLMNYTHTLTDDDVDKIIELVNQERTNPIHLGMLPFLERDYVLEILYNEKNKTLSHGLNMNSLNDKSGQIQEMKRRLEEAGRQASKTAGAFKQFASRMHRVQRKG